MAKTDTDSLRYAAELPMQDFEDAMQAAAEMGDVTPEAVEDAVRCSNAA